MQVINNPILTGFNPDPVICRKGEDYYIATSTFEWFPGVRIYHSNNLQDWDLISYPLDRVSQLDMKGIPNSGGVWAPCLTYHDGLFWLVYSNVKSVESPWKCGDNFLVTAKDITGPWSEPIRLNIAGFDPSLFHDKSGRKYITYRQWGPRHHSNPFNHIILQEYFHDTQTLSTQRDVLFKGTQRKLTEAPHIYQQGQFYYLVVAEGGTAYEHAVTVLRSRNPDGPYVLHPDETVLTSAQSPKNALQKAGHGSIIQAHTGDWLMVFLTGRPLTSDAITGECSPQGYCPLGRETGIVNIEWHDEWPYVSGGQTPQLQVQGLGHSENSPLMNNLKIEDAFIDNFASEPLNIEWQTLRIPFTKNIGELLPDNNGLRLYGREPLISQFEQATLGHRWKHFSFDAQTSVSFRPENEQQTAGLACYYNTQNWVYCFIDYDESLHRRTLKIIQLDNNNAQYLLHDTPIEIPEQCEKVSLNVAVREHSFSFSYAFDQQPWTPIDLSFDAWKLSDDYIQGKGFFTGAFVCLHCCDLTNAGRPADFHSFAYQPNVSNEEIPPVQSDSNELDSNKTVSDEKKNDN